MFSIVYLGNISNHASLHRRIEYGDEPYISISGSISTFINDKCELLYINVYIDLRPISILWILLMVTMLSIEGDVACDTLLDFTEVAME
jgi:hypothetical protein